MPDESIEAEQHSTVNSGATHAVEDRVEDHEETSAEDDPLTYADMRAFVIDAAPLLWSRLLPLLSQVVLWAWLVGSEQAPDGLPRTIMQCLSCLMVVLLGAPLYISGSLATGVMLFLLISLDLASIILPPFLIMVSLDITLGKRREYIYRWTSETFALDQDTVSALTSAIMFIMLSCADFVLISGFHVTKALADFAIVPIDLFSKELWSGVCFT